MSIDRTVRCPYCGGAIDGGILTVDLNGAIYCDSCEEVTEEVRDYTAKLQWIIDFANTAKQLEQSHEAPPNPRC